MMFFLNGALGERRPGQKIPRADKSPAFVFKNHFFQDAPFFYKKIRIGFLMRMW